MKIISTLLFTILMCGAGTTAFAQNKNIAKKSTKIDVFTPAEKDQIQLWFIEQTDSLHLKPSINIQYSKIITTNLNAIFHLTDTDKGYSVSEIKDKVDDIFLKINQQCKPIMDRNQYEAHHVTMEVMENAYKSRLNNPSRETNLYDYLADRDY